jgi:hypothetical protein
MKFGEAGQSKSSQTLPRHKTGVGLLSWTAILMWVTQPLSLSHDIDCQMTDNTVQKKTQFLSTSTQKIILMQESVKTF